MGKSTSHTSLTPAVKPPGSMVESENQVLQGSRVPQLPSDLYMHAPTHEHMHVNTHYNNLDISSNNTTQGSDPVK